MKKIVLGAVLVLLLTLGLTVYLLLSNLDGMVKTAIEKYGSEATQTVVSVEKVELGLKNGSGAIRGLTVGNPQGFAAKQAFSFGEIATKIDLKSLSAEIFIIENITIQAPEVFFELNASGTNNLENLKQNLSSRTAATAEGKPPSSGKDGGAEPKLIIRKLLITNGNIHASVVPLDKNYELKLPPVELKNLGGKNGATPTQIADQLLKVLTERALIAVKKKGIDQYKAQLEGEVNKRLEAETGKLDEKVGDKLKGVLGY
jgi:hypothetical protein